MTLTLLWLAMPIAASAFAMPLARAGLVCARIVMAGFALAALWQGIGTLSPADLRELGRASAEDARFIAFTAGVGIAAVSWLPRHRISWRASALGWPLIAGLLLSVTPSAWPAAVAGLAVGLLPAAALLFPARESRTPVRLDPEPLLVWPELLAVAVATLVIAWRGPVVASAVALTGLAWWAWFFRAHAARWSRLPIVPVIATACIGAAAWLAVTISGDAMLAVGGAAVDAPFSPAAETLLAALLLGAAALAASPWPLHAFPRSSALLPAAFLLLLSARDMAPDGVTHWIPLLTAVGVLTCLGAMATGRVVLAASSLVVLGGGREGTTVAVASMALALGAAAVAIHGSRLRVHGSRGQLVTRAIVTGAAFGAAIVVQAVLADEVVWAVALAFGIASFAVSRDRRSARAPVRPATTAAHVAPH